MRIIKFIGIFTVFSVCSIIGIICSVRLRKRAEHINNVLEGLKLLKEHLKYSGLELEKILMLSFGECKFISFNGFVPYFDGSALDDTDKNILIEYFKNLGTEEKNGEKDKTELCIKRFEKRYENAEKNFTEKGKIYTVSGICLGLTAAVLFI